MHSFINKSRILVIQTEGVNHSVSMLVTCTRGESPPDRVSAPDRQITIGVTPPASSSTAVCRSGSVGILSPNVVGGWEVKSGGG